MHAQNGLLAWGICCRRTPIAQDEAAKEHSGADLAGFKVR